MTILPPQVAEATRLWVQVAQIGLESQMVIGMRMAGLMGLLPHHEGESWRMVQEKVDAAQESGIAVTRAVFRGAPANQIVAAALRPYGQRTRANARRLSRAARRSR
ncbi:MAG: antibiotic ABC transporter [Paracoccus sp. (in: a-proteobacteria)]